MRKLILILVCFGFVLGIADISSADSWNARKEKVKKLLKKNNLVNSDRFEFTYAQKITDRMSNHFVYVLKDNKTGNEYLIYTIGDGDSTKINNLAIAPMLPQQSGQCSGVVTQSMSKTAVKADAGMDADSDEAASVSVDSGGIK